MKVIIEAKKILHSIDNLIETILEAQIRGSLKRLTAKHQVKKFFGKLIPDLFVSPFFVCTIFAMLFFITHHYIIGMIPCSLEAAMFLWWQNRRGEMQRKMFQEAKKNYRDMEYLFEQSELNVELFHAAFPDWSYALLDNFSLLALAFYAKTLEEHAARTKEKTYGGSREYHKQAKNTTELIEAMKEFGISSCVGMTKIKLKSIYKTKAKQCHPDMHPDDEECKEKFQRLGHAYETLSQYIS